MSFRAPRPPTGPDATLELRASLPRTLEVSGGLPALERSTWILAGLLWIAYLGYFAQLRSFPLQDYPNHLARADVLADLIFHGGQRYGALFATHFALAPYILHDVILTLLVGALGVAAGGAVFTSLVLLSLPCALLFYMRVNNLAPRARVLIALLSLYLATDWFFVMGFMAFRLSLAWIIVSMALTDRIRAGRGGAGWYWAVAILAYLTHLTALVFFVPVLFISGALRLLSGTTTVRREASAWLPVLVLMALHFGFIAVHHDAAHPSAYSYYWGTVRDKLRHLNWEFERYDGRPSPIMMYTFVVSVVWGAWRYLRWPMLVKPLVLENLGIAAAFFVVYCLLPSVYEDSTFVDVRALCMVALFLVLAALRIPPPQTQGSTFATRPVLALGLLLGACNLAYLALHVSKNERWLNRYREVVAAIPAGARVLPVNTQSSQMDVKPFLHAASYVVMDRAALIPYLFSADRGDLMAYFTYQQRPYMPDESWYDSLLWWNTGTDATYTVQGHSYNWRFHFEKLNQQWEIMSLVPLDWNRIACEYDFILATVPFQNSYLEVPVRAVTYNESAALLAVDKHACQPHAAPARSFRLPSEH